ncbi:type II toxin-antitoxin system HigB family toxin [Reichenbachiella sp. MALMAid0571]|uniref:type II toxin-antitoxin system HigB family toxin n=1 Tax=Reichenbachiella sp. MALMAid0571 TaxID=3143939 RepID=UPI0032DF12A1
MMFNIITRRTLNRYCVQYPEAAEPLKKWYYELKREDFNNSNELKNVYKNASIVADNRVVFNIGGNKYRLVVRINFAYKAIQIKWFGTHKEYDKIDVVKVQLKK